MITLRSTYCIYLLRCSHVVLLGACFMHSPHSADLLWRRRGPASLAVLLACFDDKTLCEDVPAVDFGNDSTVLNVAELRGSPIRGGSVGGPGGRGSYPIKDSAPSMPPNEVALDRVVQASGSPQPRTGTPVRWMQNWTPLGQKTQRCPWLGIRTENLLWISCQCACFAISVDAYYIITSAEKAEVMWSFCLSFCKQDNWRTRKRTSTKLARPGQGVTL